MTTLAQARQRGPVNPAALVGQHPISRSVYPMRTPNDKKFGGRYITSEEFYTKRVGNSPKLIQLTQESLRKALPDAPSDLLTSEVTADLTQAKLIALVSAYDSRKLADH